MRPYLYVRTDGSADDSKGMVGNAVLAAGHAQRAGEEGSKAVGYLRNAQRITPDGRMLRTAVQSANRAYLAARRAAHHANAYMLVLDAYARSVR